MPPLNLVRNRASVIILHEEQFLGFHAEDPLSKRRCFLLPGGGIEENETPEQTAVRETREETGYHIRVLPEQKTFRRYDFLWAGQVYDSRTWFFRGELAEPYHPPGEVHDAAFHRGAAWIPLAKLDQTLGAHPEILDAAREILGLAKK